MLLARGERNLNPLQRACVDIYLNKEKAIRFAETRVLVMAALRSDGIQEAMNQYIEAMFPGMANADKESFIERSKQFMHKWGGAAIQIFGRSAQVVSAEHAAHALDRQKEIADEKRAKRADIIRRQIEKDRQLKCRKRPSNIG